VTSLREVTSGAVEKKKKTTIRIKLNRMKGFFVFGKKIGSHPSLKGQRDFK